MRSGKTGLVVFFMVLTATAVVFLRTIPLSAQEAAGENKGFTAQKNLTGEVSGISNTFLAVTFGQDAESSYEMTFTVPEDVKLKGKERLSDIHTGDTIFVQYEETTQSLKKKDKEGKEVEETRVLGRVVKEITFVKAAPQMELENEPVAATEPEEAQPEPEAVTEDASPQEAETGE